MNRAHLSLKKRQAMQILDLWRDGAAGSAWITPDLIAHCLRVTGDAIGQQ